MFPQAILSVVFASLALASPSTGTLHARQAPDNVVYVTDANKYCMIFPKDAHTNIGDSEHPGGMTTYCSEAGKYNDAQGTIPNGFWKNVDFQSGISSRGARFAQLTGCIRPELVDRLNPNDAGGQYDSNGGDGGRGNPRDSVCLGMIMPKNLHTDIGDSEHPGGMTTYCSKNARFADVQGTIPDGFWTAVDFQMGVSERTGGRFAQMTGCINPGVLDRLNPGDGGGQYDSSGGREGGGIRGIVFVMGTFNTSLYQHYVQLLEPAASRACIKCCDNLDDCPTKMGMSHIVPVAWLLFQGITLTALEALGSPILALYELI
ncbi:hypothetical protein AAF712_009631 [Marasmius tenuissimus]|uniref:Uncharacterized protein n=1 Tax=Marasmius tenuissimus TaxID=585030 RepID=A0ABR2ZQM2_9AGAR